MIALPPQIRVFLYRLPTDMRKSFHGLVALTESAMKQDPLSGSLFVFLNRRRDRIKILYWGQTGFCIWYQQLEKGTYQLPEELARRTRGPGSHPFSVVADLGRNRPLFRSPAQAISVAARTAPSRGSDTLLTRLPSCLATFDMSAAWKYFPVAFFLKTDLRDSFLFA